MAHEISFNAAGMAEMAYVGELPWHGLGQELQKNASIETWQKQAGMGWVIKQTPVRYVVADGEAEMFPNQTVLYRGDNQKPLSIVSGDYHIVQPKEVLEFFRDMVTGLGMELETAGVLFGGKRFWALANTNNAAEIVKNDKVKGMLLLTSSCDGKSSTVAQFTSCRVVCNNTLSIAMNDNNSRIRTTHSSSFDPMDIKSKLGLLDTSFELFRLQLQELSKAKMTDKEVTDFYYDLVSKPKVLAVDQPASVGRTVADLMNRYRNGMGAEMSVGTAWGALNGLTEYVSHSGRGVGDHKLWNSWYGDKAKLNNKGFNNILEMFDIETVTV